MTKPTNPITNLGSTYTNLIQQTVDYWTDAAQRSALYLDTMRKRGSFAFLCDHGGGHSVPRDSQASAWRFLQDHPYGTRPSPYAIGLPSGFLRYCTLPK